MFPMREHKVKPLCGKEIKRTKNKEKRCMHTWCIFAYVTPGNIFGVSQPYPHMPASASKLITRVDLPFQLRVLFESTDMEWQIEEN